MRKSITSLAELIDSQEPIYIAHYYSELKELLDNRYNVSPKERLDIDEIIDLVVYEDPFEI